MAPLAEKTHSDYEEVKILKQGEVKARVTKKKLQNGSYLFTFTLFREYAEEGQAYKTSWFKKKHLDAIAALLNEVEDALAPAPVKEAA